MGEPGRTWIELRTVLDEERRDEVSGLLLDLGATGIQEVHGGLLSSGDGPVVAERWEEGERPSPDGRIELLAWFPGEEDVADLLRELLRRGGGEGSVRRIEDQDWNEEWKRTWKPGRLCERVLVVPSWEEVPPLAGGDVALRLDPGLAFGTGTHATTRACAELLDGICERRGIRRLLDVGTGTGILAIAALLLGAERAIGVDTDALAVESARENAARNGVEGRFDVLHGGIEEAPAGSFDVVVANLLAGLLVEIAGGLVGRAGPEGVVIVSGLLTAQTQEVVDAFLAVGAGLEGRVDQDGWVALVFRGRC